MNFGAFRKYRYAKFVYGFSWDMPLTTSAGHWPVGLHYVRVHWSVSSRMMADSFEDMATKVWNALPLNLRKIGRPEVFEAELLKHLA